MIIKGYGAKLSRLTHSDIELVRGWRNSENVRPFMEYQEYITSEMQEQWFQSIDNEFHNYYIIYDGEKKIGLIYGSYIDWNKKETGNGGIFIADPDYWESPIPLMATFILMDLSFIMGLKRTFIKVLKINKRAIEFNKNIGYELLPGQDDISNQKYILTETSYENKTSEIRNRLKRIYSDKIEIIINDPNHIVSKLAMEEYKNQSEKVKNKIEFRIDTNVIK